MRPRGRPRARREVPASASPVRPAVVGHERIAVVLRRDERLLDRPRADPADQVPHRAGLVVRARRASPAERLLSDDGAGRLVVDVEVAGRVAQRFLRLVDRSALLREDRAGEPVRRRVVDELERLLPLVLRVDVGRHDRPEELLAHQPVARVLRLDNGRLDEEALAVVGAAAGDHLSVVLARVLDRFLLPCERVLVDHGAHEVREVADVAHLDRRALLDEPLAQLGPEVRGCVHARGCRALLALVLERAAQDRCGDRLDVRARMGDDEVLATGLADDAWVIAVAVDVLADGLPDRVEDLGRAGEVDAGEVFARQGRVADLGAAAVDEVDHAGRNAGLLEQLHCPVRRVGGGRGRLPEHDVAHQGRAGREVRADGREVERRDREDEALERPVLHPVPDPGRGDGLLLVDPDHELDVEAPEVDHLAGRVDLGLVGGLRLVEHRRGHEGRAPGAGEQVRRPEEDRGALLPRQPVPVLPGLCGSRDRALDLRRPALVHGGEHVVLVVRHYRVKSVAGLDLLAADDAGDLQALAPHLRESGLELGALGASRRVLADRLVACGRRPEDPWAAHRPDSTIREMVERFTYDVEGWGTGELVFAEGLLVWHDLPSAASDTRGNHPLAERIRRYFRGQRDEFRDVELDLEWCTPFQRAALVAMRGIPYGETATYGEVAALAGHPHAQRAAGSVCASNRFPLIVPCHRVVAAGGLGSYGSLGVGFKRRLLELERAVL